MIVDRADAYLDNVAHVKTWEDACAHMALFYEWVCLRGLHREELPADLVGQPVDRFLQGFVEREVLPSLKLHLDFGVSELALFADDYDAYLEVFAPDRRAQSVARDGERGRHAVHRWWDASLAASRQRRGEPKDGAPLSLRAGLESLGISNVPNEIEPLVRDLPEWARAALMGEPALEWLRFTMLDDGLCIRPCSSVAFPKAPSVPFECREERAIADGRDITDELSIEDRIELWGPAVAVGALVEILPAHDWSRELARALEACVFVRVIDQSDGAAPAGTILTMSDFDGINERLLETGRLPMMGRLTWVSPRFAGHYRLPWARRFESA